MQSILQREEVLKADQEVSRILNLPLGKSAFYPDYLLQVVRSSGLKRLGDVLRASTHMNDSLKDFLPAYFDFAKKHWGLEKESVCEVQKGYGLLFVAHLWILGEETLFIDKVNRLTKFYSDIDYPHDPSGAKNAAQSLVASLKKNKFIKDDQNKSSS